MESENRAQWHKQCTGRQKRERWKVGRTGLHVRHLGRVPFWDIRIEGSSRVKHCKEQCPCRGCWHQPPKKVPTRTKKKTEKIKGHEKWSQRTDPNGPTMHRILKKRGGKLDVLLCMVVTLAVSHFETSELKIEADSNTARKQCPCRGCWPQPPQKVPTRIKKEDGRTKEHKKWSQRTDLNGTNNAQEDKREGWEVVDVLADILVTLAVFHFETSELKAEACRNTAKNNVHAVDVDPNPQKSQRE